MPVEVEMLGIPKIKVLRSVTKTSPADVTIDFQDGTDIFGHASKSVSGWPASRTACRVASAAHGAGRPSRRSGKCSCFTIEGGGSSPAERRSCSTG